MVALLLFCQAMSKNVPSVARVLTSSKEIRRSKEARQTSHKRDGIGVFRLAINVAHLTRSGPIAGYTDMSRSRAIWE